MLKTMDTATEEKVFLQKSMALTPVERRRLKKWFSSFHTQTDAVKVWSANGGPKRHALIGLLQRGSGRQDAVERAREILKSA
jgi:hypothetical protein